MNWGIIGHEWAITRLRRNLARGQLAQAYLFSGPAAVGKALLALRLAQAITCEREQEAPCLACRTCRRIANQNHPDVRIAGMASQTEGLKEEEAARQKDLKIDTVREWQRGIDLRPLEARARVFVLHDAERLSEGAANAMLKTLEEPPPYATLILVANSADLMPTIVSRCQVFRLRPLPRAQVVAALAARGVEAETAALAAAWSDGRIGAAITVAEQPALIAARREQLDDLLHLGEGGFAAGLRWAEQRAKEYRGGEQGAALATLELWLGWWRDLILVASGNLAAIRNIDREAELQRRAANLDLRHAHQFAQRLVVAAQQLRENANPQLVFEHLVLHQP